jgi:hypothetical protein
MARAKAGGNAMEGELVAEQEAGKLMAFNRNTPCCGLASPKAGRSTFVSLSEAMKA